MPWHAVTQLEARSAAVFRGLARGRCDRIFCDSVTTRYRQFSSQDPCAAAWEDASRRALSLYPHRNGAGNARVGVDMEGCALMAVYILLVAALMLLACGSWVLLAGRLGRFRWRKSRRLPPATPRVGAPRAPRLPFVRRVGSGHAESVLTARLFAGEIASADYRRAMAELAADDSVRHPMVVPRDSGK